MKTSIGRARRPAERTGARLRQVGLALTLTLLSGAPFAAGQDGGALTVSVQVVARHEPALALDVSMPQPGHVMREDANGRHYYYRGSLHEARAFFLAAMPPLGYRLGSDVREGAAAHSMRWQAAGRTTLVRLQATPGLNPTRISVRVMKDARRHAPG